ncbi:uncharacterized protein [Polyergus mexicanus]|uniref:uncharacterized protein isoform X2 n=1 Tax=Polyergus mexicanus TaxID=615972 RepID=UPI0038B4B4DA
MASESRALLNEPTKILIEPTNPIDDRCINIGELILNTFKSKPDFIGQVDAKTGEKNTFQQMRERSVKCALWLKKFGVRRNDIVTVCTSNHLDTYIPYLATLYIGAILTVWHEYRTIFKKKSKKAKQFESIKCILNGDFDEDEIDTFSCTKLESSKDTAVVLFSSSTIGYIRKHVAIPHVFFTSPSNQEMPSMSSNDVGLWVESLHWNISLLLTVRCILSYVKAVKINEFSNPSLEECFCDIIHKYKVNWVFLKMGMVEQFSNFEIFKKYDMSSLRQMIFSCRNTPYICFPSLITVLPNTIVTRAYCLPETGMIAFHQNRGEELFSYISANVVLVIADFNTSLPLPIFKYGFICCKSPSLTNGYFNSTTGDIIAATDNNGWFHTDEIGYCNDEGGICIVERGKEGNVISYRNYQFPALEIEQVLLQHPEIEEAVVVPIYNVFDGHHPMALVVAKEGSKITEEDIIKFVAWFVDDRKQLHAGVLFMKKLANFHSGHYDRRKICRYAKEHVFNAKRI